MEQLPPTGLSSAATGSGLGEDDSFLDEFEERFARHLDNQTATLLTEFRRDLRITMVAVVVANAATFAAVVALFDPF